MAVWAAACASAAISIGTTLPNGTTGQAYTTTLAVSGGTAPYNSVVTSGALPNGLSLAPNGVLSGTPLAPGLFSFSVQSSDAMGSIGLTNLTLRVVSSNGLQLTTTSWPEGKTGTAYDLQLTAQGGTAPYSYDLVLGGGELPDGLTMTSTGRITGTPTAAGVFPLLVRVTDANGNSYQAAMMLRISSGGLGLPNPSLAAASVNQPYSQSIMAMGGTGPYAYSVSSGNLPTGLTLASNGLLTGTPTAAGTYNFSILTTDSTGATSQANYSLVVGTTNPRLVSTGLPNGVVNQNFNGSLRAQGGTPPYTYTLVSGTLPSGLTLTSSGTFSGTATANGSYPVTIRVTDAAGRTSQSDVVLNINSSAFSIATPNLPEAFTNTAFNGTLMTNSGAAPYVFLLSTGSLPPGVVLNMNGTLAGRPTTAGTYNFVVRAFDANGQAAQIPVTIRVQAGGLTLAKSGLANGRTGRPYTSTLSASNGTSPYLFTLMSGSLPPGLNLAQNGNVYGVPTATGLWWATIRVTDATGATATTTVAIYIAGNGVGFSTFTLPSARQFQSYTTNLQAAGGTGPYTYAVSSGTLPAGLTLTPEGLLSGLPTQTTSTPFTVRVTDSTGATSVVTYLLNINTANMTLGTNLPGTGQVGTAYSYTFQSTGGTGTTTYTVDSGTLPPGLTLDPNGMLTGTPTAPGTYVINVKATDGNNVSSYFSQVFVVNAAGLGFVSSQVPDASVGSAYSSTLSGSGGTGPYTFTVVSGTLPAGLTLGSNGTITGTATTAGSYPVTLRITDSTGASATTAVTFVVKAASPITITTSVLPTAATGSMFTYTLVASGGTAPYTFTLASGSTLPAGLSLTTSGVLMGTPTANGNSTFTVNVKDANGATGSRSLTLAVGGDALRIPNATLSNGTVGTAYNLTLSPAGGTAPYTVTVVGGSLPAGLSLSSAGVFSGTPTMPGAYPVILRLMDSTGAQVQQSYTITVVGSSGLALAGTLPLGTIGQPYQGSLSASGGVAPYSYSVASGMLPTGLSLAQNGTITGTPTAAGQSAATFRVTDANGATAETMIALAIN